jgi:hypothetical protein
MTAGGDRPRHTPSGSPPPDDDGLGAFASETDVPEAPVPQRPQRRWHPVVDKPALVSVVMALAVVVYGGLMVLWWERDPPRVKPAFQGAPTASYRPGAAAPAPAASPAPPAAVATAESGATSATNATSDLFFPAVARAPEAATSRAVEAAAPAVVVPEPQPRPDLAEDTAAIEPVPSPSAPRAAAVDAPGAPPAPSPEPAAPAIVAPPTRVEPPPVDRVAVDRDAIGDVLRSYRTSYNALDATSVSTIWQGLDTRALQRAFSTLSRQDVSFDRCDVRMTSADRAVASCRGLLSYVPKIGDGEAQQRRLTWTFDFQRAAGRWLIASVAAR